MRAKAWQDVHTGWSAAVLRDAEGRLRALAASGEVAESRGALEAAGWTVEFTPACWVEECYDPVVHHDVKLTHGEHTWHLPLGAVQDVEVGGRPFRVFHDAAVMPAEGAESQCADVGFTYWSVAVVALD